MVVVSDTTAVSNLLQINSLNLLQKIYGKVLVPKAVEKEMLVLGELGFPIQDALALPWIESKVLGDTLLYQSLLEELDEGEAESIALAVELQADWLIIDEKKGRQEQQPVNHWNAWGDNRSQKKRAHSKYSAGNERTKEHWLLDQRRFVSADTRNRERSLDLSIPSSQQELALVRRVGRAA